MSGLTTAEAEAAAVALTGMLPGAEVETGETEEGARYVVAMREEPDGGLETRTVCCERNRFAILDTNGQPVVEGGSIDTIFAKAWLRRATGAPNDRRTPPVPDCR